MKQSPRGNERKWYQNPCGKASFGREGGFFLFLRILRKEERRERKSEDREEI